MLEMDKIKSNVRTCKEMLLEFKNLKIEIIQVNYCLME